MKKNNENGNSEKLAKEKSLLAIYNEARKKKKIENEIMIQRFRKSTRDKKVLIENSKSFQ
jgi:hypothetical protein